MIATKKLFSYFDLTFLLENQCHFVIDSMFLKISISYKNKLKINQNQYLDEPI
jgi:hypothetical protein